MQLLVDQEDLDSAQEVVNRFMAKAEELQYDPKEPKFNKNYERVMRMLGDV